MVESQLQIRDRNGRWAYLTSVDDTNADALLGLVEGLAEWARADERRRMERRGVRGKRRKEPKFNDGQTGEGNGS